MIKYQKPMDTMDLNGDLEGSTPINFNQVPPQAQQNQGPQVPQGLVAPPPQIKEAEKNMPKVQMDSTPINDVMGAEWETASMNAPMGPPPTMPPNMMAPPPQTAQQAKKANPMGGRIARGAAKSQKRKTRTRRARCRSSGSWRRPSW